MRTLVTSFLLAAVSAFANDIPFSAFTMPEFAEAEAEAKESGKAIALVEINTASTCPKCISATAQVYKRMRSDYVMVVKDRIDRDNPLPASLKLKTHEVGKRLGWGIPRVTIVVPDADKRLLGGLTQDQIREHGRDAFRDLEDEVEKKLAAQPIGEAAEKETSEEAATTLADTGGDMREWTNAEGRTIKAEVLDVTALNVSFKLENGKVVDYPLANLSDESREALSSY